MSCFERVEMNTSRETAIGKVTRLAIKSRMRSAVPKSGIRTEHGNHVKRRNPCFVYHLVQELDHGPWPDRMSRFQ